MIRLEPLVHDEAALALYLQLFEKTFSRSTGFTMEYLEWLYNANPNGAAIGFNAWSGNALVAHYACIPSYIQIDGAVARSMLSLNTATHPNYQGKGLFTRLAQATYEAARNKGFQAVYGVANANSTHGFVHKLGFQLIKPLEARIGCGSLGINWDVAKSQKYIQRHWDDTSLGWRQANPKNPVLINQYGVYAKCFAKVKWGCLPVYAEISNQSVERCQRPSPLYLSPFHLFLGLLPKDSSYSYALNIPQRLRPSPLNFIYKSLADLPKMLDIDKLNISFMDFDAY